MLTVAFVTKKNLSNKGVVVLVDETLEFNAQLESADQELRSAISNVTQCKRFSGKFGEVEELTFIDNDKKLQTLVVVGIGNESTLNSVCIENLGGIILSYITDIKCDDVGIKLVKGIGDFDLNAVASLIASGMLSASYKFDKYLTIPKEVFCLKNLEIWCQSSNDTENLFANKRAEIAGVFLTRDCVNEPQNILHNDHYVKKIISELKPYGITVEVLEGKELKKQSISQDRGIQNEIKLLVMCYNGSNQNEEGVAFIGKGLTISNNSLIQNAKYDRASSAVVVGLFKTLGIRKAKVNAYGVIGLANYKENTHKVGDVLLTASGKTIEINDINEDGRFVLSEAAWYAQNKFNIKSIVNLSTTPSIERVFGSTYAGCFSNNDSLAKKLIESGNKTNEKLWRMPLHDDFKEVTESRIADLANGTTTNKLFAESSVVACFISRFIKTGMEWAHLEIAGMYSKKTEDAPSSVKGAGYGVKLLNQFVQDYYENTKL